MGEALSNTNMSYLSSIPADASYVPGPNSGTGGINWAGIAESVSGIAGTVAKGYAKYSAYGREASYLDTEASTAALDARLAAQEAELYDMQGDIISMQHDVNRWQIREKYIRNFASSRAKFAKAGIDVWSGSAASVLSFILEEGEREIMIDEVNESARMFSEVTMPKFRAESKAIAYGFRSTSKSRAADSMRSAGTTSLLGTAVEAGKTLLGTKLTEKYA